MRLATSTSERGISIPVSSGASSSLRRIADLSSIIHALMRSVARSRMHKSASPPRALPDTFVACEFTCSEPVLIHSIDPSMPSVECIGGICGIYLGSRRILTSTPSALAHLPSGRPEYMGMHVYSLPERYALPSIDAVLLLYASSNMFRLYIAAGSEVKHVDADAVDLPLITHITIYRGGAAELKGFIIADRGIEEQVFGGSRGAGRYFRYGFLFDDRFLNHVARFIEARAEAIEGMLREQLYLLAEARA